MLAHEDSSRMSLESQDFSPNRNGRPELEISLRRQRELIDQLGRLVSERSQAEDAILAGYSARDLATKTQFENEERRLQQQYSSESTKTQTQHTKTLGQIIEEYETNTNRIAKTLDDTTQRAIETTLKLLDSAKDLWESNRAAADDRMSSDLKTLATQTAESAARVTERQTEWQQLAEATMRVVKRRGGRPDEVPPIITKSGFRSLDPEVVNQRALEVARGYSDEIVGMPIAKLVRVSTLLPILIAVWFATLIPIVKLFESIPDSAIAAVITSAAFAIVVTVGIIGTVRPIARQRTMVLFERFRQAANEGEQAVMAIAELAKETADERKVAIAHRHAAELQLADAAYQESVSRYTSDRDTTLRRAQEEYQTKRQALHLERERRVQDSQSAFQSASKKLAESRNVNAQALATRRDQELDISRQAYERSWNRMAERWLGGVREVEQSVDAMNRYCDDRFPPWDQVNWGAWRIPSEAPAALRFGVQQLHLNMFPRGTSIHRTLQPDRAEFQLPSVLTFPACPSLLLEAFGEGRELASRVLQNVMLRFLTSVPAGKVRFTIIDAVGLGRNFSAFMHLADYDEKLVSHRIWSEPGHINQRLTDLTEHMQDVIQTYLRNEFASIEEYNQHAGEVAEPYHVLVVANFPAGFSEEAAQRLVSIADSGARCGVYTLISTDSKLDLPRNFDLADLEERAAALQWTGEVFRWMDPVLKELPPALEQPPTDELFTDIVKTVGQFAKEAARVEVPFSTVVPRPEKWWTGDSRAELEVPLGRAGASKLQYLRLGKGTSQHVLIAGKTGSGKSTLLHAMITNLAIYYSPHELQFYLIDFKKGVEFKPYATHQLPHASVVAIESEREFGMSVLERLDVELRQRGDVFRSAGVQDIRGYRDLNPQAIMPRLMLVIDEFQEFFVQDDKLAQEAGLLLDRLVRQGRAFGIHVLLGSQTLAGAYSLARSTLGQMAVRIALQCSEADSHLILSEENTAARLLGRPGEAIYNDANGLIEGNHPFQVVWIAAQECEGYLKLLASRAEQLATELPPAIVFEGSAPANPSSNSWLRRAIMEPDYDGQVQLWLGAAVAIKDPTSVMIRRQSGANLLVVGQHEELATGLFANCIVSAAATSGLPLESRESQLPPFWILDGNRGDSSHPKYWSEFQDRTKFPLRVVVPAGVVGAMDELSRELERRGETPDGAHNPIFVLVYNISRFRELRRSDDDYSSFSSDEKRPNAAKQFATLLREGPAVGMFTIAWCDSQTTVSRWFERSTLRDFDLRVLFPMSANDSSSLIDSPIAGRLGVNRAIFFSEETGQLEKFRPYGPPDEVWLDWVKSQFERQRVVEGRA